VLHAGSSTVLSLLERLTGAQLLRDVGDFLAGFEGMYQGFADRAQAVRGLLLSPEAGFVVVAAPEADPLRQAVALSARLREDGFPLAGVVLNRVHPLPRGGWVSPRVLERALAHAAADDPAALAERTAATLAEEQVLGLRDLDAREALTHALAGMPLAEVPELSREPVELAGLARVAAALG
jgi:anion-transporting  ArsA/GET3 family ATPase